MCVSFCKSPRVACCRSRVMCCKRQLQEHLRHTETEAASKRHAQREKREAAKGVAACER